MAKKKEPKHNKRKEMRAIDTLIFLSALAVTTNAESLEMSKDITGNCNKSNVSNPAAFRFVKLQGFGQGQGKAVVVITKL